MKAYGGVAVQIHIFLTSELVGGKWSASCPSCFTPRERAPSSHWIGGWVGPRASLDNVEKILYPTRTRPLSHPDHSQPYQLCYPCFSCYGLQHTFTSRTVRRLLNIKICKTMLQPIVKYGP
jgi:hypothetical protein